LAEPARDALKVLHVITQLTHGGHESQLHDGIRATRDTCEHCVVALSPGGVYRERLRELGVRVLDLDRRGKGDPHRLVRLVHEIRSFRPDLVHGHLFTGNIYGYLALRLAYPVGSRPPLLTVRVTSCPERPRLMDHLEGMAFRASRFVLVNAEALMPEIRRAYGVSPDRIRFLPNALMPQRFEVSAARSEVRRELGVSPEDVVVGHIGSFSPEKRHDLLIESFSLAVSRDSSLALVLVGDGPRRTDSELLARRLDLNGRIRWMGWREDVPRLLKGMDLTVNCSDREGSCNAVLESLAMGVPVVATRVGGNPETLEGGRVGVLIPPDDSHALSEAIVSLAADADRRRQLAGMARRTVWQRHGPEEVYPRLLAIYRDALARRHAPPPP
jgi:glycosyltransferase involved in cell wall biosynthesis